MRFVEQPSPTGLFCHKCLSHGTHISGSHRGLCPYAACTCCRCVISKSQRMAMKKIKRDHSWRVRCSIDQLAPTICSGTVIYSSTPLLRSSPKAGNQNVADVLSNLAANTVVSAQEKRIFERRSLQTFPLPLHLVQDAPYSPSIATVKASPLDLSQGFKTIDAEKSYLNCLQRNPLVHGYTTLISSLYDLYEKQAIAAQKWSSCQESFRNDDQYQSFLEQVRCKEKEMMCGVARICD